MFIRKLLLNRSDFDMCSESARMDPKPKFIIMIVKADGFYGSHRTNANDDPDLGDLTLSNIVPFER